jgi:hypothetical protein
MGGNRRGSPAVGANSYQKASAYLSFPTSTLKGDSRAEPLFL